MAIAFDQVTNDTTINATMVTALTVAADATLLVFTFNNNSQGISAMAFNGVAMTKYIAIGSAHELWILTAPASGTNNLSAAWTGTGGRLGLFAVTYTGVKGIAGIGGAVTAVQASVAVGNLSVSSSATNLVVANFMMTNGGLSTLNNGTTRGSASCSANIKCVIGDIAGATTISLSASAAAVCDFYIIGVNLLGTVGATSSYYLRNLMGVGY